VYKDAVTAKTLHKVFFSLWCHTCTHIIACTISPFILASLRKLIFQNFYQLGVLKSGESEEEMKAAIGFGELEEVHGVVRGELELIKKLGKDWFDTPAVAAA